jgi:hypothetical protein
MGREKYIEFTIIEKKPKTNVYSVNKTDGTQLGLIFWHGAWRQYIFNPLPDTIWSHDCLDEINNFLRQLKREHQNKQRLEKRKESIQQRIRAVRR